MNSKEEDYLLEAGLEAERERREEHAKESMETIKGEWIADNWIDLLKDFADNESEAFKLFCDEAYEEYEDNK